MSIMELVQLGIGLGVFSGGAGIAKWALGVERRLYKLEVKTRIDKG